METAVGEVETGSIFNDEIARVYEHTLVDAGIDIGVGGGGGGGSDFNEPNFGGGGDAGGNDGSDGEDDGGSRGVFFKGDQYLDEDFYLEQNPDVAEDGIDPRKHYLESGYKEGRDPNRFFDTSFYLEQNPDVASAGINPMGHYYKNANSDGITRYPNQDFKTIGTSNDAIIIRADDLSNVDLGAIKSFADITELENPEVAVIQIPILWYTITKAVAVAAISIELIRRANNIQELINESTLYTFSSDNGGIDPSTPPFDTGQIVTVEQESFPNGDRFVENILDGQFEFPDGNVLFTDNFLSINSGEGSDLRNNDDLWGDPELADTVVPPISDVSDEAEIIANNDHSFDKHKDEFPGVETREDFAKELDRVRDSENTISKNFDGNKTAYWDGTTSTLVIINPNSPNGGTMYKPDRGKQDYDQL